MPISTHVYIVAIAALMGFLATSFAPSMFALALAQGAGSLSGIIGGQAAFYLHPDDDNFGPFSCLAVA